MIDEIPFEELDDLAEDGVFFCSEEPYRPYNVRLAAQLAKDLGLGPDEYLPEDALQKCYFDQSPEE